MKSIRVAFIAALMCAALDKTAEAQVSAGEKETVTRAEQYFARGEILFEAGDYAKAADAFMLAFETVPHPSALMNAALAFERSGDLDRAILIYEKYLMAAKERGEEDREVRKYLDALKAKVSELEISAECGGAKCLVLVDGFAHGDAPLTVKVLPGSHKIEATKAGELAYSKEITVAAGELMTVHLEPEKAATEPSNRDAALGDQLTDDEGERRKTKLKAPFWIASAVAVAAGGVALGFEISTAKDYEEFQATDDIEKQEAITGPAEDKQVVAAVAASAAGCAAILATIFAIRDSKRAKRAEAEQVVRVQWNGPGVLVSF